MRKSFSSVFISKPAVVVDLDDTLIHVTPLPPKNLDNNNFFTICIKRRRLYVQMRPHLREFLERVSKLFDVYFFTSSTADYADPIIDKIIPNKKEYCRLYRDSCLNMHGYYVKDLKIIKRPLRQTLLIDDSAGSALVNPKNLVRIKPWYGEKDDTVLNDLSKILESIAFENDLRLSFTEAIKDGNFEGITTFYISN